MRLPGWLARAGDTDRPEATIILIALVAGAISTLRAMIGHLIMPKFVPFQSTAFSEPVHWGLWIALSPVVAYAVRRFPFGEGAGTRALAGHFGTMALLAPIHGTILGYARVALIGAFDLQPGRMVRLNPPVAIATGSLDACWDYIAIVGLYFAFRYYRRFRERELRAAELERSLVTARLHALQSQLHPHFLFNVLHSTSMLAATDGPAAQNILVRLSDLLRRTIGASRRLDVPLSEEIDFLERYLSIERLRFSDRMHFAFEVDEEALSVPVPSLILQPLVENAVRHGLASRSGPGMICVRASTNREQITIDVEDDGVGLPATWTEHGGSGIGLANVRARLDATFGADYDLRFFAGPGGGVIVRMRFPIRPASVLTTAPVAA